MSRATVVVSLLLVLIGSCATPVASFDPSGPCTQDGSARGAYPVLEAMVPMSFEDVPPVSLDSGRKCTAEGLGALGDRGIEEVRFAGGTWTFGGIRGAALTVFSATDLTPAAMAEFYAESARAANRTRILAETEPTVAGRPGYRLDTVTGSRQQTVVVWAAAEPDVVNVVITNDLPDPKIDAAVAAFGGR